MRCWEIRCGPSKIPTTGDFFCVKTCVRVCVSKGRHMKETPPRSSIGSAHRNQRATSKPTNKVKAIREVQRYVLSKISVFVSFCFVLFSSPLLAAEERKPPSGDKGMVSRRYKRKINGKDLNTKTRSWWRPYKIFKKFRILEISKRLLRGGERGKRVHRGVHLKVDFHSLVCGCTANLWLTQASTERKFNCHPKSLIWKRRMCFCLCYLCVCVCVCACVCVWCVCWFLCARVPANCSGEWCDVRIISASGDGDGVLLCTVQFWRSSDGR